MRWPSYLVPLLCCACFESRDYEIRVEMRSVAGGLERRLSAARVMAGEAHKTDLASALGHAVPEVLEDRPDTTTAWGVCTTNLPGEFGGAGFYQTFTSELGSASFYSEHLTSWKEPWEAVERVQEASDAATSRLMSWFSFELADEPLFADRVDEIDHDLRRLLRNLGLGALMRGRLVAAPGENPGAALALQLAVEVRLIEPEDLPQVVGSDDEAGAAFVLTCVRRLAAEYLSLAADSPALDFLASADSVEQSWNAWCASTGSMEEIEKDVEEFSKLVFDVHLWDETRRVALSLTTGSEPYDTNGNWDAGAGRVSWPAEHIEDDSFEPKFRYAWWSTPDESAQRAHLGGVVLEGSSLAEYVLWRLGLHEDQAERWRAFLESLSPGQALAERLKSFRFESQSLDAKSPQEGAPRGSRLLAEALEGRE